ncbi:MAG TPA: SMP-30/gluconolactonase/LRE family protein [Steroidobacteraceae bacterium]|nr:SMP-30/gluconolactonase/LRE family protein [Steroidobacteraceae bacterium]
MQPENVVSVGNVIGEGPRWNAAEQRLYWVDFIENQNIHTWDPASRELRTHRTEAPVSALGFRRAGGLIVATGGNIAECDLRTGSLRLLASVDERPLMRLNDGAVDAEGRFWVGSMHTQQQDQPHGSLHRYDPDGSVHTMDSGITVSNGLGWSPDQRTLYFVDTFRRAVYAYDYSRATGSIGKRRVFVRTLEADGYPDGMAVDAEGHVLVAFWGGWKVARYAPDGALEREIRFPVANPTACAFGGPGLDELYVTSAKLALAADQLAAQPMAGDLFRVRLGIRGQPEPYFGPTSG